MPTGKSYHPLYHTILILSTEDLLLVSKVSSDTVAAIEIGVWEFLGASKGNTHVGNLV